MTGSQNELCINDAIDASPDLAWPGIAWPAYPTDAADHRGKLALLATRGLRLGIGQAHTLELYRAELLAEVAPRIDAGAADLVLRELAPCKRTRPISANAAPVAELDQVPPPLHLIGAFHRATRQRAVNFQRGDALDDGAPVAVVAARAGGGKTEQARNTCSCGTPAC